MTDFTPRQIVEELDRFIIGQADAKRAVAIALRNRWRRQQIEGTMKEEIVPKNILMMGPTGVGKTEIARRLAKLSSAPFVKVEATKFTEVGYVGRDVEQIIRDLVDVALNEARIKGRELVKTKAYEAAEERVLDALVGENASAVTRETFRKKLHDGELNDKEIDIEVRETESPSGLDIPSLGGASISMVSISDIFSKQFGSRKKQRRITVAESYKVLIDEESDNLLDEDEIKQNAISAVENTGIVFIDEIDKVCGRSEAKGGDISREGVQRDLLPLIEGTTVNTKYGMVKTDHILFIAGGAFHLSKPSDLLPELQGRLPIRVELKALTEDDFRRILCEPEYSLIKQYIALIGTENVELEFTDDAILKIAEYTTQINRSVENIGARRLHTILERILDDLSYEASDKPDDDKVIIDADFVTKHIGDLADNTDLSRFVL